MRSQPCEASSLVSQLIIDNTDISAPAKAESSPSLIRSPPRYTTEVTRQLLGVPGGLSPPGFPQALPGQVRGNLKRSTGLGAGEVPPAPRAALAPSQRGFRGAAIFALPRTQLWASVKVAPLFLSPLPPLLLLFLLPQPSAVSWPWQLGRPSAGDGLSLSLGKPWLRKDGAVRDGRGVSLCPPSL